MKTINRLLLNSDLFCGYSVDGVMPICLPNDESFEDINQVLNTYE